MACASGTYSTPSRGVVTSSYGFSTTCSGQPSNVLAYSFGGGACANAASNAVSGALTCNATAYTLSLYAGTGCTGAPLAGNTTVRALGCVASGGRSDNAVCTSGAAARWVAAAALAASAVAAVALAARA